MRRQTVRWPTNVRVSPIYSRYWEDRFNLRSNLNFRKKLNLSIKYFAIFTKIKTGNYKIYLTFKKNRRKK